MNPKMMEAIAAFQAGRPDQAEKIARDIARRRPDDVDAQRMIGLLCNQTGRHDEAVAHLDAVLRFKRRQPQINYLRGLSLLALNRFREALDDFDRALAIDGPQPDTFVNRGAALQKLQRMPEAIESYDRAIALDPGYAPAHTNRAIALEEQGRLAEALAAYERSLRIMPSAEAWFGRGTVLALLRRFDEALAAMKKTHSLEPSRLWLAGEIMHLRMQIADWDNFDAAVQQLLADVDKGLAVTAPGHILALPSSPAQQRHAAETHARIKFPPPQAGGEGKQGAARSAADSPAPGKITIGYFSCDFHDHPLAQLAAGLFEQHDRSGFTVIGFSYGGPHDDEWARRIANGMDRFTDVSAMSDQEAAALARSLGVDIAVELTGITFNTRPGIFAYRAAPVQAAWLGHPGTTGCAFYDYAIADEIVLPPGHDAFYIERPWRLAGCYQVQDSKRLPVGEPRGRAAYGLPEQGFVFCCFNAGYKITPDLFAVWMRLLKRVEGSVLWLLADNAAFMANLRKHAKEAGVDPARLVFAERADLREYLARHRCADLALDTFYYNGHTTTSDALWAGVPVVTKKGEAFAGRVAASLLTAAGLPDLITESVEGYEELSFRLATEPARLEEVKQRLAGNRAAPGGLFDTAAFARNLEAAYRGMMKGA